MTRYLLLEPLDVLYLRGNRLFEGAGAFGEALMPPWPSVAAGAIRSRMLADSGEDLESFASGQPAEDRDVANALGTTAAPGRFRVTAFGLARRTGAGIDPCLPLPADVMVTDEEGLADAAYLQARELPVRTSGSLQRVPILRANRAAKAVTGLWLNGSGIGAWLAGAPISASDLLRSDELWQKDPRLGIALDTRQGSARHGMLYTAETIALKTDVSFLVGVDGADAALPVGGLVRLGGDGRGAALSRAEVDWPEPDLERITAEGKFRLMIATPGIFAGGWRPPGLDENGRWQGPQGVTARLVAAAVPRAGTVSGWDLARRQPKPAARTVPAGAVYWFDGLEGPPEALGKLAVEGLWEAMSENEVDAVRRAEGFNNCMLAPWPDSR